MNRKKKRDGITRRQFLKSASIGAGVISLGKVNLSESAQLPNAARREKCDVVVIGTGLAALSAAIEATSQGAKVVVLEKVSRDKSGGNSRLSAGIIATPSEIRRRPGTATTRTL
jgi:NADPH-dependent 2,4-dienoyl-CoA reductase/sulfur reductase-like enzyme